MHQCETSQSVCCILISFHLAVCLKLFEFFSFMLQINHKRNIEAFSFHLLFEKKAAEKKKNWQILYILHQRVQMQRRNVSDFELKISMKYVRARSSVYLNSDNLRIRTKKCAVWVETRMSDDFVDRENFIALVHNHISCFISFRLDLLVGPDFSFHF